jgi:WhiB family redox-sensing transcriptional regulator
MDERQVPHDEGARDPGSRREGKAPVTDISRLPAPTLEVWEWQAQGACRGLDTQLFFHPEGERGPRRAHREATAKAICATCPVLVACREHALAVREPYGIWGGLSEHEREALCGSPVQSAAS